MPAKEYNEVKMRGILPSDGMDAIPVTEGAPLTEINSRMWVWDSVGGNWVKSKGNAAGELTVNFATPIGVTESSPLTSIQVEPKANATPIPVGKIPDGGTQILAYNNAINATVVIYTVPAATVFYLLSWNLWVPAVAVGMACVFIRNGGGVQQYMLEGVQAQAGVTIPSNTGSLTTPMELPATWDIVAYSSAAALQAQGSIFGYEI